MDAAPQTFFYTISNLIRLQESKNILEVGCGAGKLLSTILDLKKPETSYNATDVSEGMVKQSQNRLKVHF
jgi:ubiquinone/menaquinone biosynthesis C-methylase UbiE